MNVPFDDLNMASTVPTDSSLRNSKSGWRKQARLTSWYKKVYRPTEREPQELLFQFREITKHIFKRDHYQCQACLLTHHKLRRLQRYLTCHHINPRANGGSLLHDNLITLCNQCHDYVEEQTFRSREEIFGCQTPDYRHYQTNLSPTNDWHRWVYGGYRKPI